MHSLSLTPGAKQITARSPLRYPGGKSRAAEVIVSYFPAGINELMSPFFGGGSVELFATTKGIQVTGYDIFAPLVEFWQCLAVNSNALANEVLKYYPLAKESFYKLQRSQETLDGKMRRAAVYYVLNRSSFSGATLSGGMSPNHPRFTISSIDRLRKFHNPKITVHRLDFVQSLRRHPDKFAYLDPPYLIKSSLYGKKGNAHKYFDHELLAKTLKKRNHWILSYNDCTEIRLLYSGFKIITLNWKYGMPNNKSSSEMLVFSKH